MVLLALLAQDTMGAAGIRAVTTKGQVTIPKEIRKALGIHPGDKVLFDLRGHTATVQKVGGEKLSDILARMGPVGEDAVSFQTRLRREWDDRSP
jgi:AbrB family looped-hinge helix DNA binding protein